MHSRVTSVRTGRRPARLLLTLAWCGSFAILSSACYQSVPITSAPPPTGTRIVARLTPQGSAEMAPWIGAGAHTVEGKVISAESSEWRVSMLRVEQVAGPEVVWNRELVTFPAGAFGEMRERRLDQQRSFLAGGILAVGAVVLGRIFFSSVFEGSGEEDPGPNPPQ